MIQRLALHQLQIQVEVNTLIYELTIQIREDPYARLFLNFTMMF